MRPTHKRLIPYVLLTLVFAVAVVPLALKDNIDFYGSRDEARVHYPATLAFLEQFPALDFSHNYMATTPLYQIMLMPAALIVGIDIIRLRLISMVLSLTCLLAVYRYLSKRGGALRGLLFSLIFLLSPYFVGSAIRLASDNTALLFAFLSMMMLDLSVVHARQFLLANVLILFAALTRQIYVWLVGASLLVGFQNQEDKRIRAALKNGLPTLIPVVAVAYFLFLWGGLSPPSAGAPHELAQWGNWDALVYVVSLVGLYGAFFFPWFLRPFRGGSVNVVYIVSLAVLGVVFLLLHPVSNEYDQIMRGGSLWLVAANLPMLFSTSIVFWCLFPMGLVWLYVILGHLMSRQDYLMAICFPLWCVANMVSGRTYQRYYEPFILFFIGYWFVTQRGDDWFYWIGPGILLAGFISMDLIQFVL